MITSSARTAAVSRPFALIVPRLPNMEPTVPLSGLCLRTLSTITFSGHGAETWGAATTTTSGKPTESGNRYRRRMPRKRQNVKSTGLDLQKPSPGHEPGAEEKGDDHHGAGYCVGAPRVELHRGRKRNGAARSGRELTPPRDRPWTGGWFAGRGRTRPLV